VDRREFIKLTGTASIASFALTDLMSKVTSKARTQLTSTKYENYLKVIIDRALPEPIPGFLADILTLNLDVQAKHADLVNMDNNKF
jgi:hypothetical protein